MPDTQPNDLVPIWHVRKALVMWEVHVHSYQVPTEQTLRHSHQRPIKISGNETHNSFERTFLSKKKIKLVHDGLFQFCRSPSHCRRSRSVLRGDRRLLSRIPGYRPRKATIIAHSSSHLLLARRSYHLL